MGEIAGKHAEKTSSIDGDLLGMQKKPQYANHNEKRSIINGDLISMQKEAAVN
jgi:hypothetical protein